VKNPNNKTKASVEPEEKTDEILLVENCTVLLCNCIDGIKNQVI
jgi:hypothetical protein